LTPQLLAAKNAYWQSGADANSPEAIALGVLEANLQKAYFNYSLCADNVGAAPLWFLTKDLPQDSLLANLQKAAFTQIKAAETPDAVHEGLVGLEDLLTLGGATVSKIGVAKIGGALIAIVIKDGEQIITKELTADAIAVLIKDGKAVLDEAGNLFVQGAKEAVHLSGIEAEALAAASITASTLKLSGAETAKIALIRDSLNLGAGRNIAYAEGSIAGREIGEILGVSGRNTPGVAMPDVRIFRTSADGFPRDYDAEVYVLEALAQKLQAGDSGIIRLISERAYCSSCSNVIIQFKKMFPNVTVLFSAG
jgi:hypothetical protein